VVVWDESRASCGLTNGVRDYQESAQMINQVKGELPGCQSENCHGGLKLSRNERIGGQLL
jgi:hypothetical protein